MNITLVCVEWLWIMTETIIKLYSCSIKTHGGIVSIHCREEGCIGLYIPNEIRGQRGCTTKYSPTQGSVRPFSIQFINPSLGMYRKIPSSGPISIDSAEINSSLVMMREYQMYLYKQPIEIARKEEELVRMRMILVCGEWLVVITDDYYQIDECICANSRLDLSKL